MRTILATLALALTINCAPLASYAADNVYANGDPESSDQNYVPTNKIAYAIGFIHGGGCEGMYEIGGGNLTALKQKYNVKEIDGDESGGDFDAMIADTRKNRIPFCEMNADILRDAGFTLIDPLPRQRQAEKMEDVRRAFGRD